MTTQPIRPDPTARHRSGRFGWMRAAWLILRGTTWRVALPVALVVGTLLAAVNQGSTLIRGTATATTLLQVAANYAIPYVVSSIGYLSAPTRRLQAPTPGAGQS